MPIRRRKVAPVPPQAEDLRRRLTEEWRNPTENQLEPVIIEEDGTPDRPIHLYVVWSEWAGLDQRERSEIIMEAFEEVRGIQESLRVTVAMGLTQKEAKRLNILYE